MLRYIALLLMLMSAHVAIAQEDTFRELVCRMAVGNVVGHDQPMLELYGDAEATWKSGGSYGLYTGMYYGSRGWSGHGSDLNGEGHQRWLADGTQFTNADAAKLRSVAMTFRQKVCENQVNPL